MQIMGKLRQNQHRFERQQLPGIGRIIGQGFVFPTMGNITPSGPHGLKRLYIAVT